MNNKINNAANILFNARIKMKRILKLPKDCIPLDKKEAYKIQRSLVAKYLSQQKNIRIIGKKIGCTNKIAQKQINVLEPFYGDLISNYVSKSNCTLEINKFFKPYIEYFQQKK